MTGRVLAVALACAAIFGRSVAAELSPGSGYSVHVGSYHGTLYYTVGKDGILSWRRLRQAPTRCPSA
jgi:hypothetical protein